MTLVLFLTAMLQDALGTGSTQETIIYRLVTRNRDFNAFLEKILFWQENLAHWVDLLGLPLTRKIVFKNFGPRPPLALIIGGL